MFVYDHMYAYNSEEDRPLQKCLMMNLLFCLRSTRCGY